MNSFTKDIINKPNISKGRFTPKKSNGKAIDKKDYYIYRYQLYGVSALFFKVAGGVGGKIFEYLKFKDDLNGHKHWVLPNNLFYKVWNIRRQRIKKIRKRRVGSHN